MKTKQRTRFYLDTEFHEAPGELVLISIALVGEDGREFYAVSSEFDPERCNPWVRGHVLPKLTGEPRISRAEIRTGILAFIGDATPEVWGYFADYDWVLFCWLFGAMVDLPEGFPFYCRDIKQAMDDRGIKKSDLPPQPKDAHHALADARWIREAHAVLFDEKAVKANREHWAASLPSIPYIDDAEDRTNYLLNEHDRLEAARVTLANRSEEVERQMHRGIAKVKAENERLRQREADIIEACERVADGGQYRADIIGAIQRIRRERDAARAVLRRFVAAFDAEVYEMDRGLIEEARKALG